VEVVVPQFGDLAREDDYGDPDPWTAAAERLARKYLGRNVVGTSEQQRGQPPLWNRVELSPVQLAANERMAQLPMWQEPQMRKPVEGMAHTAKTVAFPSDYARGAIHNYPPGSEEAQFLEDSRQRSATNWGRTTAFNYVFDPLPGGAALARGQSLHGAMGSVGAGAGQGLTRGTPARAAPAILSRQAPTADDIAAIRAAAGSGRAPWPKAERDVFATTPEAYAETLNLVPQASIKERLPGPLPGEKLPEKGRAEQVIEHTPELAARIAERLDPLARLPESELFKFYHTGPVIRGLQQHAELTLPEANQFMLGWSGQGAATSPRTQTPPNLRNASHLLYERAQGNPVTPERFAQEGNIPGYGMMGMHVDLADKFAHGRVDPWLNPKPTTFQENWRGNLADVTGDTHNIRGTLYELDRLYPGQLHPSWFASPKAYEKYRSEGFLGITPGDIKDTLGSVTVNKAKRQSEYLPMTEPWRQAAAQIGIHPAEAQSGGWFSYGPLTGLLSPPSTVPRLLNDQIYATAKVLGVSPEKAVNWWARGKIPLAGVAGGAVMGKLAAEDEYQQ
jgi:hypothetical protein